MPDNCNTLVITGTTSGKIAVVARYRRGMPWRQVDSCITKEEAEEVSERLERNSRIRCDTIDEWINEKWGPDAPVVMPPE